MNEEKMIRLLDEMNVLCRDDGHKFTIELRLDVIKKNLENSQYILTKGKLCHIYSKKPLNQIKKAVVVSSHVDCEEQIHNCFSEQIDNNLLKGTYDNSITNTAILTLMLKSDLPDNIIVSFTGDEEINSKGAIETCKILKKQGVSFKVIVLDVTNEGWDEERDISLENNFFNNRWGKNVIDCITKNTSNWCFVPEDPYDIPGYVPFSNLIHKEAEPDESWDYDEMAIKCFSLCLPVYGEMHSDDGVLCRRNSFFEYTKVLEQICMINSSQN